MCEELNRKEFHEAIDTTLSGLQADPWLAQRVVSRERTSEPVMKKKLSIGFVLMIFLILTVFTAFALTNGFGLFDFIGTNSEKDIPQNVEQYTMHELGTLSTEHFTVNIREGYYDGITIHLIYDVIPKDKGMLLLSNGPGMDESWYGITHLQYDRNLDDGKTILDRWGEGGYTSCWITDVSIETDENMCYSGEAIWDEANGMLTGQIEYPFSQLRTDRTLSFVFQASPLKNVHDENSMDYDRSESDAIPLTLNSVYSGEERILCSTEPISLKSVGAQIDLVRLIVLPADIQYQINYSVTDSEKYHSFMDDESHSITKSLSFKFVELNADGTISRYLKEGISDPVGCIDDHVIIGYLGVSELCDEYTLAVYENTLEDPLEFVTVKVQYENNWTWTPEERVWQQESDRSKPHNQADDTFVNPTSDDLPEAEAVAIARSAIIQAYGLPEGALDHSRTVSDMYVTNQRPNYRRWFIQFQVLKEGSDDYVEKCYSCIVGPDGKVISDPDINEKSVFEYANARQSEVVVKYNDYIMNHAGGWVFQYWTPELKADFSEKVLPEVSAIVESGNLSLLENGGEIDYDLIAIAMHRYGLPRETDISVEQAYQIAVECVQERYGLNEDIINHYDQWYYFYDITNTDNPKWNIVFWPSTASASLFSNGFSNGQGHIRYRVEISASTGDVMNYYSFEYSPTEKSLSYLQNLY